MTPVPGAAAAAAAEGRDNSDTGAREFNAVERDTARRNTVVILGDGMNARTFTRVRKDWNVSREQRQLMREQETLIVKRQRVLARIAELGAEQLEASTKDDQAKADELESTIVALIAEVDTLEDAAKTVDYKTIDLLLELQDGQEAVPSIGAGPPGSDEESNMVRWLKRDLDVDDALALCKELIGGGEADPPTEAATPTTGD